MSNEVYADSAYRSAETEQKLKAQGFGSRMHKRGRRNRPLTEAEDNANRRKSKVHAYRARVRCLGERSRLAVVCGPSA